MTPRRSIGPVHFGPGEEFDLIRRLVNPADLLPTGVSLGPGDDAAVLEGGWVLSTDLSLEGVHFRRAWLEDQEIGFRAVSCALSDLAAMAAVPVGVFISMAANGEEVVEALQSGCREAASEVGAVILGGDLSNTSGPVFIDVVSLGSANRPGLRSGAVAGNDIWVTGRLGASSTAVRVWQCGGEPPPEARKAFAQPSPRCDEGHYLVERGIASALIDLSDGLAGDSAHLAAASGVQIVLEEAQVPVAPIAAEVLGPEEALQAALHGGEDYELCFAAGPDAVDPSYFQDHFGLEITRVGYVREGSGVWIDRGGSEPEPLIRSGFDHYTADVL
ncbi:MAG: thiamine-phosphate kinase [Gemmatimonadota bacterium]|nr:thiamine-phosphate kinase [Gemmatimonadota bacterium]